MPSPKETLDTLNITVESEFVPFSQSRYSDDGKPCLNWRVTIKRDGCDVLTFNYKAGLAHCPSYKQPLRPRDTYDHCLVGLECETGFAHFYKYGSYPTPRRHKVDGKSQRVRIEPDAVDVVWAVVCDSEVLDARALSEIASWCEMAANALRSDDEDGDRKLYEATATNLRSLAHDAHRKEAV